LKLESVDVEDLKVKPKKKSKSLLKIEALDHAYILKLLVSGDKLKRLEIHSQWDKINVFK
jgi:hypothetical protein